MGLPSDVVGHCLSVMNAASAERENSRTASGSEDVESSAEAAACQERIPPYRARADPAPNRIRHPWPGLEKWKNQSSALAESPSSVPAWLTAPVRSDSGVVLLLPVPVPTTGPPGAE